MSRAIRARAAILATALVLAGGVGLVAGPASAASAQTTRITVSGARLGPAFQGIGAISGGGGNSRYLIDYPRTERNAILDELFRPGRGASLQLLKLEIGGNGFSSDGAEPSVAQRRGQVTCDVGYEFWLARQALARNPRIALYGLQWSAPSWVRAKDGSLWSAADISYLLDWLGCARRAGLTVSYLGGWNEHYSPHTAEIESWYVALRRALDTHGYRAVRIVAADAFGNPAVNAWGIANDMATNPALARAVSVIGVHDVCGVESHGYVCTGSTTAEHFATAHGTLLWHSELGRTPSTPAGLTEEGPAGLARSLLNGWIDARITGTLLWPIVDAMPPGLPFSDRGLVHADQPWSGNYVVSRLASVVGQTTEFVEPGWRFVDGASGTLVGGGSYVTWASADRSAWTLVAETSTAPHAQLLRIRVAGRLPGRLHLVETGLATGPELRPLGAVRAVAGVVSVTLPPGALVTVTSRPVPARARAARIPRAHAMPLPYVPHADAAGMPAMLAPMEGAFVQRGTTIVQTAVGRPVEWTGCDTFFPYAVAGDATWKDYTVSARVTLPSTPRHAPPPGALLVAGFQGFQEQCEFGGDELRVDRAGNWHLVRNGATPVVLASGRVRAAATYRLSLGLAGRLVTATIDGRRVAHIATRTAVTGPAGLGALGFDAVRFTDFAVRRT